MGPGQILGDSRCTPSTLGGGWGRADHAGAEPGPSPAAGAGFFVINPTAPKRLRWPRSPSMVEAGPVMAVDQTVQGNCIFSCRMEKTKQNKKLGFEELPDSLKGHLKDKVKPAREFLGNSLPK